MPSQTRHIFFIDACVADYSTLISGLPAESAWFVLDADQDGFTQMQSILADYSGLDSIQIISHGAPAKLYLGSAVVTVENLAQYEAALGQIGGSLTETGDVLLYGCNVAQGEAGLAFINMLALFTGADVAASEDFTGAAVLGGDGELERTTGAVEVAVVSLEWLTETLAPAFAVGSGKVTTDFGGDDWGYSVTVQADGKIVVTGSSSSNFALARYNTNGSLDSSFDGDGKVTTDFGGIDGGQGITVQGDGKILVAGSSGNGYTYDFALARYNTNGSLDTSFDGDGKIITDFGGIDGGQGITVQGDGKILVAGYIYNNHDFALARYNINGSLDTSFDGDGKVITDFGGFEFVNCVTLQADGKILVAGWGQPNTRDFALARYNINGSLDTSFDGDGKVTTDFGGFENSGYSITTQANGKILVAGYSYINNNRDFALARYNIDGSLDTSFDGDGKVATDFGGDFDWGFSIAVQADGKILVAGHDSNSDFALARYNTNGSLDTSFDGDGKIITDFGGSDYGYSVTVQTDGKILVVGTTRTNNYNSDFALARYNSDGSLDTTFSTAGLTLIEGTPDADTLYGTENADPIFGLAGNDVIHSGLGNDTIDGGTGTDIVNYTQQRGNFSLQATDTGWTVNGPEGLDTLTNVERLQFSDKKLALDLGATQNGGQAVKFIGALAYPLAKDAGTFGLILDFFDQGYTLSSISDLAVSSGLTASLAGSGSNADLAKLVFRNIVGGEADAVMTDMLVGFMDGRQASYTQGEFLAAVADLELNQEHVGLVGLQLTGLEYL